MNMPPTCNDTIVAALRSASIAEVCKGLVRRLPAAPYDDKRGKVSPNTYLLKAAISIRISAN